MYHDYIAEYIKPGSSVLDMGCGRGVLAGKLVEKGCRVLGVELDADKLKEAGRLSVDTICSDLDKEEVWREIRGKFDYVIFVDVLEHLKSPWVALALARKLLNDGGEVIAHIPNVSYWSTRLTLLSGEFEYDSKGGIFDSEHLRFFNYYTMRRMFEGCGYGIKEMKPWIYSSLERELCRIPFFKWSFLNLFAKSFTSILKAG